MTNDATQPVIEFLDRFTSALGVNTTTTVEQTADGPRINIGGDEAEILVRHRGEPLESAAARRGHGVRPWRCPTRSGCSSMRWSIAKARTWSCGRWRSCSPRRRRRPASINNWVRSIPYERRIVHLAVANIPGAATESIGDAFSKTIIISARK